MKPRREGLKLYLPVDFVVADRFSADAVTKCVTFRDIPQNWMALDIGPASTILPGGAGRRQDNCLERPNGSF